VNSTLMPAIVNDIADQGNARAEEIDDALASDAATQVARLILSSSLSRSVGAHFGLSQAEIIEYLAAPNRMLAAATKRGNLANKVGRGSVGRGMS
jgi:hypothetical protein